MTMLPLARPPLAGAISVWTLRACLGRGRPSRPFYGLDSALNGPGSATFRSGLNIQAGVTRWAAQTRHFSVSWCRPARDSDPQTRPPKESSASPLRKVFPLLPAARENVYTLPNVLTFSRLLAAPIIGYCVLHDCHGWALGLLGYAGVTDLLDGWIARRWNQKTVVGTVIDPMADKVLVTVLVVALATNGALPLWLASVILGRDVGLGIAAIYYRWISLPPPKTFARYWDFSLPSAEVRPTTISKYNTALQLGLLGLTTVAPVVPADLATTLALMQYLVATTTVWSGASYIYSKDAVRILPYPGEGKK